MKHLGLLLLLLPVFFSCKKENAYNPLAKEFIGVYKGNLYLYNSQQPDSTVVPLQIQIFPSIVPNQFTIANGVLISSMVYLTGNAFNLQRTTVASSTAFKIVEYGSGRLLNKQLLVDFHQDYLDSIGKTVSNKEWKGELTKQ